MHQLEKVVHGVPGLGGVLAWVVNTLASALIGLVVGVVLVMLIQRLPFRRSKPESVAHEG